MRLNKHILVVDDDPRLRKLLSTFLKDKNYFVDSAKDTKSALFKINNIQYDLVILDVMMPGESGLIFAKKLRKNSNIPILMLSAMAKVESRIAGFEIGVDEYLTKPFDPRELLLRINVILKRINSNSFIKSNSIHLGNNNFDIKNNILYKNGKEVLLTPNELKIILKLYEANKNSVRRTSLAKFINVSPRTIDVTINRLRKKIEKKPSNPLYIVTVRGVGYKMELDN